ncbi:MAG: ABC transporter ATP-binding protein [Patescibacteria group bacterium]
MFKGNLRNILSTVGYSFRIAPLEMLSLSLVTFILSIAYLVVAYLFKLLLDRIAVNDSSLLLIVPLLSYVIFKGLVKFIHVFRWSVVKTIFRWKLQDKLWLDLHAKFFSLDISHFENSDTFNSMLRARENINWRPYQLVDNFFSVLGSVIGFVVSVIVATKFGFFIPLLVSLSAIPHFLLSLKFGEARWSVFDEGAESNKKMFYLSSLATSPENMKEIRTFRAESKILNYIREIQNSFYQKNKSVALKHGFSNLFSFAVELIVIGFVLVQQVPKVTLGLMSIGDFSFLLAVVYSISDAVGELLGDLSNLLEESLHVGYFFDVMNLKNRVKLADKTKIPESQTLAPKIEFRNVSFRYREDLPDVLSNVSFIIEPGENVALVGENGAGKTTIIKLLMRFYDASQGEILIGGVNVKDLDLNWWYKQAGTLFQNFIHYNFSVKESISLEDKKIDLKRVKRASRLSGAAEFIEKLPNKYDQMLGTGFENGIELSGGQWQKIALARAFYKMPPLLVLDEPTSAIDAQAEYEIFKNINRVYKDEKSLLIISHRFSTVRNAEKILVIEGGRITEQGTHGKLLDLNGKYSKMFKAQAKGYK